MGKNSLKWQRAQPIYKPDNIMSSKAREKGDLTGFVPKYEADPKINMNFIMNDEYMRLWFKERDFYKKENYVKQQSSEQDAHLRRRYVQRMNMNNKRPTKHLPIIEMKRFQNIPAKVDDKRRPGDVKMCPKYLVSLEEREAHRYKPECQNKKSGKAKAGEKSNQNKSKPRDKKSPNSGSVKSQDGSEELSVLDYCK